jgi:hypothetical protein
MPKIWATFFTFFNDLTSFKTRFVKAILRFRGEVLDFNFEVCHVYFNVATFLATLPKYWATFSSYHVVTLSLYMSRNVGGDDTIFRENYLKGKAKYS